MTQLTGWLPACFTSIFASMVMIVPAMRNDINHIIFRHWLTSDCQDQIGQTLRGKTDKYDVD